MTTNWKERVWSQSDRGFLTNDTGDKLADNSLNKLNFHTWIFVNTKTKWKEAR